MKCIVCQYTTPSFLSRNPMVCFNCGWPIFPQTLSAQPLTAEVSIMMSTVMVVDPSENKQSSRGSCIQPVEQLPQAYWSAVGWQPPVGGDKLLIGSSLEEWQMLPLDESYTQNVVQECNEEELGGDFEMSSNLWMEDATTAASNAQSRLCEDSYDDPLGDLPMSPTYELQLQDYPLQEHIIADDSEAEPVVQPPPESLSGSWLDTTTYVDQLTNYDQLVNPTSSSSTPSTSNVFSISHGIVSDVFNTADDGISTTKQSSYSNEGDSFTNMYSIADGGVCSNNACGLVSTTDVFSDGVQVKSDPAVAAEEVNEGVAEEVMAQLIKELGVFQQSRGDGSSGPASLGSISGADLEELVAQMFGSGTASDDQWGFGSSVDPLGSTVDHVGSTVDPEVLWNVDSGYQTSASTSPSSSDVRDMIYLTSDNADVSIELLPEHSDISVGFVEDVVTEDSVTVDESSALASYFLDQKSQKNSSHGSSVQDESDDDESLGYSDDDDSLSDEEFKPSAYHSRSYTGTKQRGRAKMSAGKRNRREEYALLTPAERRERKREQNKNAATKYREKKRLEELERDDACDELEKRNAELRREVGDKEREVKVLRRLVINIFRQSTSEVLANSTAAESSRTGKKRKLVKKERL